MRAAAPGSARGRRRAEPRVAQRLGTSAGTGGTQVALPASAVDWDTHDEPWPDLLASVVGRVTSVEAAAGGAAIRAWIGPLGPLRVPARPDMARQLAPGVRVRVTYHRERAELVVDDVRLID